MIPIRHFIVVIAICIFFIVYIWQNIEVMKIKMGFNRLITAEKQIIRDRNRILGEIESLRKIDVIEARARELNLKRISRDDFIVLMLNDENERKKNK